jgi:biopolymer transport protein ExbB/TolQ
MPPTASTSPIRLIVFGLAIFTGLVVVSALSMVLGPDQFAGAFLLDRGGASYPFTVQNVMWVMFFIGLGELLVRSRQAILEWRQVGLSLLPEDETTMLRSQELGPIYARSREAVETGGYYLQRLIVRAILQFQGSKSVDQANSLVNSSLELYQHEIDLKYNMLRYLVWLIPTLGFIGTVIGIAMALDTAGNVPDVTNPGALKPWMKALTSDLGVAFNTTLLALILSAILVFLLHIIQEHEELALNRAGQYCLDNLINRLYEK